MSQDVRICIIVPTKDNQRDIGAVLEGAFAHHPHVYVVDDGCTDGTRAIAEASGATVLVHEVNRGKAAAMQTGFARALADGFTHAITMDADGQHLASDLPAFLAAIRGEPGALFVGVRDMATAPGVSRFGRANSNFWVWVETGHLVGDTQTGFRAYPLALVTSLPLSGRGYAWEVEVLTRALWAGIPVRDIDVEVYYPPAELRVSSFDPLRDNLRISWMNARLVVRRILWPPYWLPSRLPPDPRPTAWTQGSQSRGFALGWYWFVAGARLLGPTLGYLALLPVVAFYAVVARAGRRGLGAYLRRRFPEDSALARWWKTNRIFYRFAQSILDRFLLMSHHRERFTFDKRVPEPFRALVHEHRDQGLLVLSAHVGNAEMLGMALKAGGTDEHHEPRPVSIVRFDADPPAMKEMRDKLLGDGAPRFIVVNRGDAFASLAIVRALREGQVVAMHADRVVDDRVATVRLFGGDILLPTGPLLVAALAKVPVVFCTTVRDGHTHYRFWASEPRRLVFRGHGNRDAQLAEWAQWLADELERLLEAYPLAWYNFHDPWAQAEASERKEPPGAKPSRG